MLITTMADDMLKDFFNFSETIRLSFHVNCLHSNQVLFLLKNEKKKSILESATNLLSVLRVNLMIFLLKFLEYLL